MTQGGSKPSLKYHRFYREKPLISRSVSLVFVDGDCFLTNHARDYEVLIEPESLPDLAQVFSLVKDQGVDRAIELLSPQLGESRDVLLDELRNLNLLETEQSLSDWYRTWSFYGFDLGGYLASRYHLNRFDYSKPDILDRDRQDMEKYLDDAPYPPLKINEWTSSSRLGLIHPSRFGRTRRVSTIEKLSALLFWPFGVQRGASFLEVLPTFLKSVPSKGCRHPFDAFVVSRQSGVLDDGGYYYDPEHHCLHPVHNPENLDSEKGLFLAVFCSFERVQWRYRQSWAYKDLYLDLGHIVETLRLVANETEVDLVETEPAHCIETPLEIETMKKYKVKI